MATFCLLHGAWHDPSCWALLAEPLEARGHAVLMPELPLGDPAADFDDRAAPAIEALGAAEDGPIVVVGHSTSSGCAALVAVAYPGAILVHLCPRLGQFQSAEAPKAFRADLSLPPERDDGTSVWEPEAAIAVMYPRLDPALAQALAARRVPFAMPAGRFPLLEHPDIPTALVYAARDEFFEPAWSRWAAREIVGVDPIEIPGGHFPMVEDPAGTASLLDRLARGAAVTAAAQ